MHPHRVLVLQTAVPSYVKRAMEDLLPKNLLGPSEITVFSRAIPDELAQFHGVSWIDDLIIHDEGRGALRHMLHLRSRHFDVVVVFFTRDPSYWKMKVASFLCGGRHMLIFNEHLGCFFFTPSAFIQFCRARAREWQLRNKQKIGYALGTSQGHLAQPSSIWLRLFRPVHLLVKVFLFPFRLLYLLGWTAFQQDRRRHALMDLDARIQTAEARRTQS